MKKILTAAKKVLAEALKCFLSMVIFLIKGVFALVMLVMGLLLIAPITSLSLVLEGKGSLWSNYEGALAQVIDSAKGLLD